LKTKILLSAILVGLSLNAQNLPVKLKRIPSATLFGKQTIIFEAGNLKGEPVVDQRENAVVGIKKNVAVDVDGTGATVAAIAASVKDSKNGQGRYFQIKIPVDPVRLQAATHLVIELGEAKWVKGFWGPLSVAIGDGMDYYGGNIYEQFMNKGGLLQTCFVELKNRKQQAYDGKGKEVQFVRISGNAPQTPNTLFIKKIYAATILPQSGRTIVAQPLTEPNKLKVYPHQASIDFEIKGGTGEAVENDTLEWKLCDFNDVLLDSGTIPFPAKAWKQGTKLSIAGAKYPAGFFYLYLKLTSDNATVDILGTRPEGYLTFGVLPDIQALPLTYADQSRFGAQGTNYLYKRDPLHPLYTTLGIRWNYYNARPIWSEKSPDKPFTPKTDAQLVRQKKSRNAVFKYAYLTSMLGLPPHMMRLPDYVTPEQVHRDITRLGQGYPIGDATAYTELLTKLMDETSRMRKIAMPHMSRNYYELHWEPDWHWRGTEDEFIQFYECASKALAQADPGAILTAANYGVLDVGNAKLKRLFEKGLGKYINGLTTHLYLMKAGWPEAAGLDLECRKLRKMADTYIGKDAPIFQTEGGTKFRGSPKLPTTLRGHLGTFLRGHLIALGEGFQTTWFFYTADHGGLSKKEATSTGYGFFFNQDSNNRAFGADNVAPKPLAMGIAAMTRLLEGTNTLGRLDYFGEGVYVYSFQRADQILHALWSPFEAKQITLEVGEAPVTVYDVMGNSHVQTPVDGKLALKLDDIPVYVLGADPKCVPNAGQKDVLLGTAGTKFSVPAGMTGTLFLERAGKQTPLKGDMLISPDLASGTYMLSKRGRNGKMMASRLVELKGVAGIESIEADIGGFRVVCTNQGATSQKLELSGGFSAQKERHGFKKDIELAAKRTQTFVIPFEQSGYDPMFGTPSWKFELRRKGLLCSEQQFVWGGVTPDEYSRFSPFYGKETINYHQQDWKNMEDFSFRYRLREEKASVKLWVEVKDDSAYRRPFPKGVWRTDAVIAAFGSQPEPDSEWQKQRIFMIRLNEDNEAEFGELIGTPARTFVPVKGLSGKVTRNESTKLTSYELSVPFSLIGDPKTILKNGRIGFGLSVHDVDNAVEAEKDAHRAAGLFGGAPFFMKSMKFGTIYLK
jgi:hypothetical protein